MARPTSGPYGSPLLDNFNRADEDPIGAPWTGPMISGSPSLRLLSNELAVRSGQTSGGIYYTGTYTDCEAWVVLANKLDGSRLVVAVRTADAGTANVDQYRVDLLPQAGAANDITRIGRLDNSSLTTLGADIVQEFNAADDGLGIAIIGSTIEAWRWDGATWNLLGTRTDSTYTAAGNFALEINGATSVYDDFGGGAIGGATVAWMGA